MSDPPAPARGPLDRSSPCVRPERPRGEICRHPLPTCRIELFAPWDKGLDSIAEFARLEVLYWLHESRRDLALQAPKSDGNARGVFSLRTPVRPNPIGTSIVVFVF